METTDRMMIMGLCLQGLLANPRTDTTDVPGVVKLAHLYAAKLAPEPPESQAAFAIKLSKIVYEAARVSGIQDKDLVFPQPVDWPPFEQASSGQADDTAMLAVFEAVADVLKGRTGGPSQSGPLLDFINTVVRAAE
jgi:hypothetical protein